MSRLLNLFPATFEKSGGRGQFGFTLVEVAIALLLVGLALASTMVIVTSQIEARNTGETQRRMEVAKASLASFVAKNSRLPCPAVPTLNNTSANYGVEAATPGTCTSTVAAGANNVIGVVPWVTLGIESSYATDPYGNFFTYNVVKAETNRNSYTVTSMRGNISIHSGTPVSLGLTGAGGLSTQNQINACSTTQGDNGCNIAAVVVLVSHGKNSAGAYLTSGVKSAAPSSTTNPAEWQNAQADTKYVTPSTGYVKDVYDDIVFAITPEDLLFPLAQQGAFKTSRAVTNDRLQSVKNALLSFIVNNSSGFGGSACNAGTTPQCRYLPLPDSGLPVGTGYDGVTDAFATTGVILWDPSATTNAIGWPSTTNVYVRGQVPYSTLGMQQWETLDGWGSAIQYIVYQTIANTTTASGIGMSTTTPASTYSVAIRLWSYGVDKTANMSVSNTYSSPGDDIVLDISPAELRGYLINSGRAIP
jgi:prepilin-type N-terminal cleavage/methylation domain-containing protein